MRLAHGWEAGKEGKVFFFEKKKQKTFIRLMPNPTAKKA